MAIFFYFWSGSANKDSLIPEGNYNGITVSKTSYVVGNGHGVDWQRSENTPYKGRTYQKLSYSSLPRNDGSRFTLGSNDSDTLVVKYVGFDANQEQIFKKQLDEHFVVEFIDGLAKISVNKVILEERCRVDSNLESV